MPRLSHAALLVVASLALAGCCRDNLREMASLKDVREAPPKKARSVAQSSKSESSKSEQEKPDDDDKRSTRIEKDDDDDDVSAIETGSVAKPSCQGQHLAYQATKEYLKNFGPKPADEPGERGPCTQNR
jgi:hypothetical protein